MRPELIGADLISADLSGADLTGADLRRANLSGVLFPANSDNRVEYIDGADLTRTDLTHADLSAADLRLANLTGANLTGAILTGANFTGAILVSANLTGAELCNAHFEAAFMEAANLSGATLDGTTFADTDLSKVVGLNAVRHRGPSTIGIDSLYLWQGRIPEQFLRGCGVPEEFIRFLPSLIEQPIQFFSCFISHSHEDKAFARLLHDRLQGQGIRCWLDEHQLLPGDDLHEGIDRGIRLSDKVLLSCSKAALKNSWWVDGEVNRAFQKEAQIRKERGKKVLALIPLNLDGFLFSADYQGGKKAEITSRVAANFVGWEKDHALFDRELEKVIRALRTDAGAREQPPPAKL
jgi:hypothetical protein